VHETGIAIEIYRGAREAAAPHDPARLEWVRVAVGELTGVEPELLKYAWEAVVEPTPDRGCRLEVEWRPALQRCLKCGEPKTRGEGVWLRLCLECGEPLQVEGGRELDLLKIGLLTGEDS